MRTVKYLALLITLTMPTRLVAATYSTYQACMDANRDKEIQCCPTYTTSIGFKCPDGWTYSPSGNIDPYPCKREPTDAGSDSKGYKIIEYSSCAASSGTTIVCVFEPRQVSGALDPNCNAYGCK